MGQGSRNSSNKKMGVATRGVKFKFSAGERVLCYEPDPTKAKVLYESKVLDLVVSRDERGRKVPEYLIHFYGWNSSWDRCVREEFILPYTEENQELQSKLANEAALSMKGKRKSKLPPLIKETLNKKLCNDNGNKNSENKDSSHSGSDTESSEDDIEKDVSINIPDVLKLQLEEDWREITKKNKLIKLPCQPNIITILEGFVKHLAAKLLCASPPRIGTQHLSEEVKHKLNLCKETMDGLRVYFDFTLPHLLLYCQEKKQYYTDGMSCLPLSNSAREIPETTLKIEVGISNELVTPKMEVLPSPVRVQKGRHSKIVKTYPVIKTEAPSSPETKTPEEKCFKKPIRGRPRLASTRILRSSDKTKQSPAVEVSSATTNQSSTPDVKPFPEPGPSVETRVTRKSLQQTLSSPPPPPTNIDVSIHSPPPITSEKNSTAEKSLTVSHCPSTDSSSHSTFSTSKLGQQYHLINNASMLQDVLTWHILPQHFYEQIPAAPSLIYGAQHLLRLFVKLPDLLSKMSMSSQKSQTLVCILESFLILTSSDSIKGPIEKVYKTAKAMKIYSNKIVQIDNEDLQTLALSEICMSKKLAGSYHCSYVGVLCRCYSKKTMAQDEKPNSINSSKESFAWHLLGNGR
ncbi:male-specific lethal 3 homolog [Trichonephila inaurata madagascariensis]|uniref:Protein male-specific lethal-3 n=1 Tax=Trichonephila inaurata madagascariensis TaxID=2747483 RepID=A0A8X6IYM9_9ARAC|nr:male-specific lethal 3 homolog [Trichonephila inaurata madagascariensis]